MIDRRAADRALWRLLGKVGLEPVAFGRPGPEHAAAVVMFVPLVIVALLNTCGPRADTPAAGRPLEVSCRP